MTEDSNKGQIDVELRRLGSLLGNTVERSAAISGAKNAIIADAVLAFQRSQQRPAARLALRQWIVRFTAAVAITACFTFFMTRLPQDQTLIVGEVQDSEFAMDELSVALSNFSDDFSAEFPTDEHLMAVNYDDFPLSDLDAGFLDNTTLEDFNDEFETA